MALRCKPGDLAIVVRSRCGNEGREVQVLRWLHRFQSAGPGLGRAEASGWMVEARHPLNGGKKRNPRLGLFLDADLMPIRPEREPEHIDRRQDREIPVGEGYEVLTVSEGIAHG